MVNALSLKSAFVVTIQVVLLTDSLLAIKWSSFEDKEYAVVYDKMNWHNALKYCVDLGGRLAHPDTAERNNFLISLTDKTTWLWLGASNAYDRKTWEWHNPWKPMTFTYWHSTEPNRLNDENCLLYFHSSEGYKWGDDTCVYNRGFICQRDRSFSDPNDDEAKIEKNCGKSPHRSGQKCLTIWVTSTADQSGQEKNRGNCQNVLYKLKQIEILLNGHSELLREIMGYMSKGERLHDLYVLLVPSLDKLTLCTHYKGPGPNGENIILQCREQIDGRFVKLMIRGSEWLHLSEVKVFGCDPYG